MARDSEVEVIEILSEMCSLDGVPGGLIEATLGCLEGSLFSKVVGRGGVENGMTGGVSTLGV